MIFLVGLSSVVETVAHLVPMKVILKFRERTYNESRNYQPAENVPFSHLADDLPWSPFWASVSPPDTKNAQMISENFFELQSTVVDSVT